MKITTYASIAVIALAMSIGAASAEEMSSDMRADSVSDSSASAESQFVPLDGIPSTIKMTNEQLSEIVAGNGCGQRRRWFHRFRFNIFRQFNPCDW